MWLLPMFVSPRQFRAMIHGITPLGDALTTELEEIFAEALCSVSFDVFFIAATVPITGLQEADRGWCLAEV